MALTTHPQLECYIQEAPLDIEGLRRSLPPLTDCGGYVAFEGIIRDINHGRRVTRLEYEAYDTLAEKELKRIAEQAIERFGLRYVRAVHRKGALAIGDTAVIIQVLSRHRREAFEGCRFVIDQLKARVPVWKREFYGDGSSVWTQCHDHSPEPLTLGDA